MLCNENKNNRTKFISIFFASILLISANSLYGCTPTIENSTTETPTTTANTTTKSGSFVFSNSGIVDNSNASGYKIEATTLTINDAGTYSVSGSCSDGQIKVKKGTTGVNIILDGLDLTSQNSAAISCNKSSEVKISVTDNTINTLTDTEMNNDETNPDNTNAENAVLKCKDGSKVYIDGTGQLNIVANGKNGIKSGSTTDEDGEASLSIKDVTLNIKAIDNDAINAENSLNIESGNIEIEAGNDALHSDYDLCIGDSETSGPTITITNSYEGIEASNLVIDSGNINITSSDDCLNAANSDLNNYDFKMQINGGNIKAYASSGDGFDSNGDIDITGGDIYVATSNQADNQPLDADGEINITGGNLLAIGCSAGMGMNLTSSQAYLVSTSNSGIGGNQNSQKDILKDNTTGSTSNVALKINNSKGTQIAEYECEFSPTYIFYTSQNLNSGDAYTVDLNGTTQSIIASVDKISSNMGAGGMQQGGASPEIKGNDRGLQGELQGGVTDNKHNRKVARPYLG